MTQRRLAVLLLFVVIVAVVAFMGWMSARNWQLHPLPISPRPMPATGAPPAPGPAVP